MVEALPDWLTIAVGGVGCFALPFVVVWLIWSTARSARGIGQGLAGGSGSACQALGLTLTERGPLSGAAAGSWRGCSVRVSWVVGHQQGYDVRNQLTYVSAQLSPPLQAGLHAVEGGAGGGGIGWPELERVMTLHAADPARARAALARGGPLLWSSLGGPGRLSMDDASVTLELPGVSVEQAQLEQALERVVRLAEALSGL